MISQLVLTEFHAIPQWTTDENEWNGAWNMLLCTYSPLTEGWVVKPLPSGSTPRDSVDFSVIFKVERDRVPVLFVEVKAFKNISSLSARKEADSQIRQRFIDFYDATPTVSTGISAFGHTICKYELNKEDNFVTPEAIPDSIKYIVDVAPRERWDLDLTTDVGGDRILAIFEQVKSRILAEAMHT